MKNKYILLIMSLILCLFISTVVVAQEEELVDPEIPESWYEAPKKASEMDINEFDQSPMLDEKVEKGELPPVEERLPDDPPVIEPYEEVGKYGGTATVWHTTLTAFGNSDAEYVGNMPTAAGRPAPDGRKNLPYFVEDWKFSDDYTDVTLYLREGIKFSNGTPLTADDYLYWWEHEANNEDWASVLPENWKPVALEEVEKIDDFTVKFSFDKPHPRVDDFEFASNMGPGLWGEVVSAEFMQDFHPDFVGEDKVLEMAEKVDLDTWDEYYGRIRDDSVDHPEYEHQRPVLNPYIAVERSESRLVLERNPYYPFVDTEGNQLPYIDEIVVNLANDAEMASTKAATGEATLASRNLRTKDIPLYKRNEGKENYKTFIYYRAYGSEVAIQPNLTHKDEELRKIFQNDKFRKAMSLAIDRKDINKKVYYDRATPMQATVPPINEKFKQEYADAYAEYDPKKAEELLDEMGMVDVDDDGYRETPDGEDFKTNLLYCKLGPVDPTPVLELVDSKFDDIGLNVDLQMVSRELKNERGPSGDFDISVWTADGTAGMAYGNVQHMAKVFAPSAGGAPHSPWPGWINWYDTDGEEGMEPPEEIKELTEALNNLAYDPDESKRESAAEKILKAQAENVWAIGTVGLGPQPLVVSNNLKNIPKKGVWDSMFRYMKPMYPVQFYLDE